jgi:hypothetical protein
MGLALLLAACVLITATVKFGVPLKADAEGFGPMDIYALETQTDVSKLPTTVIDKPY